MRCEVAPRPGTQCVSSTSTVNYPNSLKDEEALSRVSGAAGCFHRNMYLCFFFLVRRASCVLGGCSK